MNQKRIKKLIFNFLSGEYFTDALRITLSIVVPSGILFALDLPQPAIGVAHGALLIALTDIRGTIEDKRTTSVVSILLFFIVSLIAILSLSYPWLTGALFFIIPLGCSMLTVYGNRFSVTGTAAIVLMIFIWGLKPSGLWFCFYLLLGGIWYYAVSLIHIWMWPARYLRYAISDCLIATHDFLKVKALFYDTDIALQECYNKAILSHNRVSEAQQQLRSILLRDKSVMHTDNRQGQALLFAATKTIDLYEQITAVHYHYDFIRQTFAITGALDLIRQMIGILAADIRNMSEIKPFQAQTSRNPQSDRHLSHLMARFEYIIQKENPSHGEILSKLMVNLKHIHADITAVHEALTNANSVVPQHDTYTEYSHFAPFETLELKQFTSNFRLSSPVFRFSLRLALTCVFCYTLAQAFDLGIYSYWILITVVVIIKPAFSLTRQRNIQRLTGTLIGVAIAMLLLSFVGSTTVLLLLATLFLLGFFTFNRTHHLLSVIALTPMVIIAVYIYGSSGWSFVIERVYDTLIGCGIAFAATYLFPTWEAGRIGFLSKALLKANTLYLEKLLETTSGKPLNLTTYKLARKNVYIEQANLSAAFQRMLGEPSNKIAASENVYHFQMLNHILSANIASMFVTLRAGDPRVSERAEQSRIGEVITSLSQSTSLLENTDNQAIDDHVIVPVTDAQDYAPEKYQDQLYLLTDIAAEIRQCCIELRKVLV
jgi:uncharacterized membrane protein YccC